MSDDTRAASGGDGGGEGGDHSRCQPEPERFGEIWNGFDVHDGIDLRQIDDARFSLRSCVFYGGDIGLAAESMSPGPDAELTWEALQKTITEVRPQHLRSTDLASVPGPFRWWLDTYGPHTAPSLIHDRFIGTVEPDDHEAALAQQRLTPQQFDRYYRYMLRSAGVPGLRRGLIWAAVATRTRATSSNRRRKYSMFVWMALALVGVVGFGAGIVISSPGLIAAAMLAPLPASLLWGSQIGAGLLVSYIAVPLVLPPTLITLAFRAIWKLDGAIFPAPDREEALRSELRSGAAADHTN